MTASGGEELITLYTCGCEALYYFDADAVTGRRAIDFDRLGALLANLASAGALTLSFVLGQRASLGINRDAWRPNPVGRPAPGTTPTASKGAGR